ncbi:NYN domain-containing protein [Desulfofustis glycolicus]|uniref:TIGR00288 family protein n=1 Tax=Desulfofustis glycolicus DSM 9705 TaxID=1121409 RepID=A0A1M5UUJ6_9BACT|nr:NYN domain-containing protein [Desulfofustis glycolicus]MCB2215860.1 NYN domain-containing protein [Desulfobulbaceae bacterium]SHH66619.1 TIGR00288 family protein [Desulfofustis glycolicus DSM 9705]
MAEDNKIALLIDCDNVSHRSVEGVIDELSKYGKVNIRNAYGNWKSENMKGWEEKLHPHAIKPIQQFAYTTGKNATDAAMIIDAMDLLYTQKLDAFALMTSDSDFTPLVMRILANGITVYGFGEKKTPGAFVRACSQFIYTENLEPLDDEEEKPQEKGGTKKSRSELKQDATLVKLLRTAVEQAADEDGWSHLGRIGQYISNKTSFSPVNYGYKKLGDLIRAIDLFEIKMRHDNSVMYIKDSRK